MVGSLLRYYPAVSSFFIIFKSNTTYETELARISKELGWDAEHAHLPAADFTIEERRYWAWNDRFWTISIGFALGLFPFMTGKKSFKGAN